MHVSDSLPTFVRDDPLLRGAEGQRARLRHAHDRGEVLDTVRAKVANREGPRLHLGTDVDM